MVPDWLSCEYRARAGAEGVAQDPSGASPGTYVAVHLADVPAAVAMKLVQRVEASSQVSPWSRCTAMPCLLCMHAYMVASFTSKTSYTAIISLLAQHDQQTSKDDGTSCEVELLFIHRPRSHACRAVHHLW